MCSQPTVMAQPVVVHVLCGWCGDTLWEAHYNTTMYNKYKKYCTNANNVAYATHSGSYSTEHKKEVNYTRGTQNYSGKQRFTTHMQDTETFGLPEGQVASTMISVLILFSTLTSQWGGDKGREETLC